MAQTQRSARPAAGGDGAAWPTLPYPEWRETRDTLHMYSQVLGKLRLALSPFEPQWANVALYVAARGLTTSPIPAGPRTFDAELDLLGHELVVRTSDGRIERRPLGGAVADFYRDVVRILDRLGVDVQISTLPSEVADPIPFPDDHVHATYEPLQAARFFQVLARVDEVLRRHRARFRGRTSPVQFFWGTFDLALQRFSGRRVEPPANAGIIRRLGGDAETICAGWWPGDERARQAAFYAYGYPKPDAIEGRAIEPEGAGWSEAAGEFVLPYDDVRGAADPAAALLRFLESTYAVAARLMSWDPELAG